MLSIVEVPQDGDNGATRFPVGAVFEVRGPAISALKVYPDWDAARHAADVSGPEDARVRRTFRDGWNLLCSAMQRTLGGGTALQPA